MQATSATHEYLKSVTLLSATFATRISPDYLPSLGNDLHDFMAPGEGKAL